MRNDCRGMTLSELLVAAFLFGLFTIAAVSSLSLALRQQQQVAFKVNAIQNARYLASTISNELKQAVPNPGPAGWSSVTPALSTTTLTPEAPTAVLTPNMKSPTSNSLTFTEPDPVNFNPMQSGWNPSSPQNYRQIRYTVTGGNTVTREVISYNAGGTATSTSLETVARGEGITLGFTSLQRNLVQVDVTCTEGPYTISYRNTCYIAGR